MSVKIETRFAPSVVKAAQMLEAMTALSFVSHNSALFAKAQAALGNIGDDFVKRVKGVQMNRQLDGYEIKDCVNDMREERRNKAQHAKQRRLEREAKAAMQQAAIAA